MLLRNFIYIIKGFGFLSKYRPSEMFRRPEVLHRPKIEKREGYRYCSSKGEEKGVQYTPLRPLSTNLSFNQVLQVLNK